ncbi:DUF6937 domain-containing protein [Vibrio algarum]|uniref:Glycosyl transferase family 28 C-terminal domain-containing protein n=1 Tax=Vibrio algarum TaxID=3020714 RepID=A0ABT4YR18_9VIBR|nr:hypothetical protein [Vibrio sp. KJ40-1]MDB1123995.1 hypothetical protein [Vibrio sp. KJ40-1]
MPRTHTIFGNPVSAKVINKAEKQKQKYLRKFGDDSGNEYGLTLQPDPILTPAFDTMMVEAGNAPRPIESGKALLIGNIRMGYGHYRIAMAIASAAKHFGYIPYWFDMSSFEQTTGTKVITHLNKLYSLGSRLSQKSSLFNRFYWDPLNSKGFLKLEYNAIDQKVAELMTPIFKTIPTDIPFIGTHTWTAQAAVHAGMNRVINVIPDNWPMGLHLSEGSIHTVQTPSSYFGYKTLKGMAEGELTPMPEKSVYNVGHYIDHELLQDLEGDTQKRLDRIANNKPKRLLLTVGGAGAQYELYRDIVLGYKDQIDAGELVIYINVGDHKSAFGKLRKDLQPIKDITLYENDWQKISTFAESAITNSSISGVHIFCQENLFAAVYATNLLMRSSDILITKPSELAFYPVPKLMIKRVGGHEAWGAIRAAEVGDGTSECVTTPEIHRMLKLMLNEPELLTEMNHNILKAQQAGIYDGAYNTVKLAVAEQK